MAIKGIRTMASLMAMVALVIGEIGCAGGHGHLAGKETRGLRYDPNYTPLDGGVIQPYPLARSTGFPSEQLLRFRVTIPAISDSTIDISFRTYRSWVAASSSNLVLSQDSSPVSSTYFYSSDPGVGTLYTGSADYEAITTGQDFDFYFKMKSSAPLGQYTIHGLATDSNGHNYGVTATYILESSSAARAHKTRKVGKR